MNDWLPSTRWGFVPTSRRVLHLSPKGVACVPCVSPRMSVSPLLGGLLGGGVVFFPPSPGPPCFCLPPHPGSKQGISVQSLRDLPAGVWQRQGPRQGGAVRGGVYQSRIGALFRTLHPRVEPDPGGCKVPVSEDDETPEGPPGPKQGLWDITTVCTPSLTASQHSSSSPFILFVFLLTLLHSPGYAPALCVPKPGALEDR